MTGRRVCDPSKVYLLVTFFVTSYQYRYIRHSIFALAAGARLVLKIARSIPGKFWWHCCLYFRSPRETLGPPINQSPAHPPRTLVGSSYCYILCRQYSYGSYGNAREKWWWVHATLQLPVSPGRVEVGRTTFHAPPPIAQTLGVELELSNCSVVEKERKDGNCIAVRNPSTLTMTVDR